MHIFEPMDRMIAVIKDVYGEVVQQTLSNCRFCYIIYGFTRFSFCISISQTLPKNSYIYIYIYIYTHTYIHTYTVSASESGDF